MRRHLEHTRQSRIKGTRGPLLTGIARLATGLVAFVAASAFLTAGSGFAASGPVVTFSCNPAPTDCTGWYRQNVTITWSYSDPSSTILNTDGCNTRTLTGDTQAAPQHCYVENGNEQWTKVDIAIKVDRTPPQVAVAADRGPDSNGWYVRPVAFRWNGADATSGIASCSAVIYGGPDRASVPVSGGCADNAGNTATSTLSINYDATAPVLKKVSVTSSAGLDVVRWRSSSASDTLVLQRSARGSDAQPVVFRRTGTTLRDRKIRSDVEYTYTAQTFDQAGNPSRKLSVTALPKVLTLRKLRYVPRAAPRPILRWERKRGAAYYHVQLFRGSKRILAAWPETHHFGLPAAWKWGGHRYRLHRGHYRWYVWAGLGRRSFARYRTIGSAQFIVPRR
jgi:hypothetical protein